VNPCHNNLSCNEYLCAGNTLSKNDEYSRNRADESHLLRAITEHKYITFIIPDFTRFTIQCYIIMIMIHNGMSFRL